MKRAVIRGRFVRPLMSAKPEKKRKKESLGLNRLREARLSVGEVGGCIAAEDTFRFQGIRGEEKEWNGHSVRAESCRRTERDEGPSRPKLPKGPPPYDGAANRRPARTKKEVRTNERRKERRARDYLDLDGPALRRMSRSTAGGGREDDAAAGAEVGDQEPKKGGRSLELVRTRSRRFPTTFSSHIKLPEF
jgi:hypothetical protein